MSAISTESKELELIERVDLKFALADTPEKLELNLQAFLAPLLLKLASPYHSVRTNVLNSLKNVLSRLSSLTNVKLPVEKLITQAKSTENILPNCHDTDLLNNVKLYSLLLASRGIDRLRSQDERKKLLPIIMNNISKAPFNVAARLFHILCKILLAWEPPLKGTPEEQDLIQYLHLNDEKDLYFLLDHFTKFFLLVPAKSDPTTNTIPRGYTCPGLSSDDVSFFTYSAGVSFTNEQYSKFKNGIFKFVCNGFVSNDQLLIKFLSVVTTDKSDISDKSIQFLKRLQIPYEDEDFIDYLIDLYTGDSIKGIPPVKRHLQEKILTILNNSIYATTDPQKVSLICSIGLHSNEHKLRSLCLTFIRHVAKYNYTSLLPSQSNSNDSSSSPGFQTNIAALIRNNLHSEGWPLLQLGSSTPTFNIALQQRRLQYETLGDLLKKDFNLVKDLSYIEFLFDSLKGDLSEFNSSIQEALLATIGHLSNLPEESKVKLKDILRNNLSNANDFQVEDDTISERDKKSINDKVMSLRLISIKFTNACFEFADPEARLFNVWGTTRNNRFDIIEEATKGLQPYWFRVYRSSINTTPHNVITTKKLLEPTLIETKLPSFQSFVTLLLENIKIHKDNPDSILRLTLGKAIRFAKQCLISEAIFGKTTTIVQDENWSLRMEKALNIDQFALSLISKRGSGITDKWYIDFLKRTCVEFLQVSRNKDMSLISAYTDTVFGEVTYFLLRYSNKVVLVSLQDELPYLIQYLERMKMTNENELELCGNILGIISSSIESDSSVLSTLFDALDTEDVSTISLPTLYACSYILSRMSLLDKVDFIYIRQLEHLVDGIVSHMSEIKLKRIVFKMFDQVLKFGLFSRLSIDKRKSIMTLMVERYKDKITNDEIMVEFWGYLSLYSREFELVDVFYSVIVNSHESKQVEYLFTAGEALSVVAGGWNSTFLINQIDMLAVSNNDLQKNFGSENLNFVLPKILDICNSTKPSLKRAACIWLLSLTEYLGRDAGFQNFVKDVHFKFMRFLASNDEFIQDSAARGLSLIYELGSGDLKEEMVKGLLRSFTSANETLTSGSISGETQLFEPGTLNTDDGSISTYKDIMNLATEVGDPSLVYKFMTLAKSSSLWTSRKGVAFGLSAIMSKSSLERLLLEDKATARKLIPILYRYRYDPYAVVSRAMNEIWNSLVFDSSTVISVYFEDILKETLDGIGNKEWRVREGSVIALTQLVQSQPLERFSEKILDLWTMGFRSMDDIKESVREVGTKFMKVLANLLAKSIDVSKGVSKERQVETLKIILPFLLGTKGLESDVEDIRKFSLSTLLDLVKNTGDSLQPFAPQLIYNFSLLFSIIEPQVINYLALNSKNYNLDSNIIDSHRKSAVTSSPIFEAIEKLIYMCDVSQVESLINYASKSVKKSVGLPSKVAASHIIILLVKRYNIEIQPYTGNLLKVCMNMFEDRNEVVNLSYAQTFGYLNKVSLLEKSLKYARKLNEKYFNPSKDNSRKIVGHTIESILKYAPAKFESIASSLMPLIFVASNDVDEANAKLYGDIWTEASTTGSGTVKLYLKEILEILAANIKSTDFTMRRMCGKSISVVCANVDTTVDSQHIRDLLKISIESLYGRTWDGKEILFESFVDACVKFKYYIISDNVTEVSIKKVLGTEISRNNMDYVKKIIISYNKYLENFDDIKDNENMKMYISIIDKIIDSYDTLSSNSREFMISTSSKDGVDEDTVVTNKRVKPNYEVSEKSSEKNIKNEEYFIRLIKSIASVYVKTSSNSELFLKFILNHSMSLLDNKFFVYTWRSEAAINDIGIRILDKDIKLSETLIFDYWNFVYLKTSSKETTVNVKLKLIKFGSIMINRYKSQKPIIQSQLRELTDIDPTSRIVMELKNVGLN